MRADSWEELGEINTPTRILIYSFHSGRNDWPHLFDKT